MLSLRLSLRRRSRLISRLSLSQCAMGQSQNPYGTRFEALGELSQLAIFFKF